MLNSTTFTLRTLQLLLLAGAVWMQATWIGLHHMADGVYIVCMVSDPRYRLDMRLKINGKVSHFVAYGQNTDIGGLTVAVPFKKGDRIWSEVQPYMSDGATGISVGFVSSSKDNYLTVKSDGSTIKYAGSWYVQFQYFYTAQGRWEQRSPETHFKIAKDGMYWVMARPDCDDGWANLDIGGLFTAYCGSDHPLSASGAFYLKANDNLYMKFTGGHVVESATILSYVLLENNTNVAYTGMGDERKNLGGSGKVSFGTVKTDYGNLYDSQSRTFNIRVSGSYIVAIRGHPIDGGNTRYDLHQNGKFIHSYFAQSGVKSGQAAVFRFKAGDELKVLAQWDHTVDTKLMMSIALLRT